VAARSEESVNGWRKNGSKVHAKRYRGCGVESVVVKGTSVELRRCQVAMVLFLEGLAWMTLQEQISALPFPFLLTSLMIFTTLPQFQTAHSTHVQF
jgi:hypothetical protein